jgi:hypothetical protein
MARSLADRSFEHPGRNFQPAIRVGSTRRATENNALGLLDRLMDEDLKFKQWAPRIQKLPKHGPVGVLKPRSTTPSARMNHWATAASPGGSGSRAPGCATPTSSARRAAAGPNAAPKLTLLLEHPMGPASGLRPKNGTPFWPHDRKQ